jgi:hypothetical protein
VSNPYEVDDEGRPVAEAEPAAAPDPAAEAAIRRQIDQTLRFMRLQTALGIVVIVALALLVSSIRGVLVLVGIVYLVTSLAAYWYLRRNFNARLRRGAPSA